ncbi:MAG: hypothetical protein QW424_00695 [Candidatus Bathyarchaeia archaeon]
MSDFKTFKSFRYRRYPSYWSISKRLGSIWSQNEQIIAKLKDIICTYKVGDEVIADVYVRDKALAIE